MVKDIKELRGIELIRELSLAFGPSGCEERVRELIEPRARELADKTLVDKMGNLICKMSFGKGENKPKIMLSAHMDEVGFMIDGIRSDGFLTFGTVGGIDPSVMAGRKIMLEGKSGMVNGVICSKAIHQKEKDEREKASDADKLYIDIGADSKETAQELVQIGTYATFDSEFYSFGKDKGTLKCKALDDRMGCAALIELMESLRSEPPAEDVEVYFCFTVREEIGYSGAVAAARLIAPDLAIVLETTAISDIPETPEHRRVADVGEGGVLSVADRSTVYDIDLVRAIFKQAGDLGIKVQIKRYVSGGNDAGHIHKVLGGIKTVALSVPTRYLHSAACVAYFEDYLSVCRTAEATVRNYRKIINSTKEKKK